MSPVATALAEPTPPYRAAPPLGPAGEAAAARHLEARGWRILERGYRTRAGEIDLIADDHGVLVFVEVKTRRGLRCGLPAEAVGARKRAHIVRVAQIYLMRCGAAEAACRFDVIEVLAMPGGTYRIHHLRDAFQTA